MTMRETISDPTRSTVLFVDLTDAYGQALGRTIAVGVDYTAELDLHYGADADGHHGVTCIEYVYQDAYIDQKDLLNLNSNQVEQLLRDAQHQFTVHGPRG